MKFNKTATAVMGSRLQPESVPPSNFFRQASITPSLAKEIKAKGLVRVAGNHLTCVSTKDFWAIKGGKLVRISKQEVDNGDTLAPADVHSLRGSAHNFLDDFTF
jgi:hypothetical protein